MPMFMMASGSSRAASRCSPASSTVGMPRYHSPSSTGIAATTSHGHLMRGSVTPTGLMTPVMLVQSPVGHHPSSASAAATIAAHGSQQLLHDPASQVVTAAGYIGGYPIDHHPLALSGNLLHHSTTGVAVNSSRLPVYPASSPLAGAASASVTLVASPNGPVLVTAGGGILHPASFYAGNQPYHHQQTTMRPGSALAVFDRLSLGSGSDRFSVQGGNGTPGPYIQHNHQNHPNTFISQPTVEAQLQQQHQQEQQLLYHHQQSLYQQQGFSENGLLFPVSISESGFTGSTYQIAQATESCRQQQQEQQHQQHHQQHHQQQQLHHIIHQQRS
ncbi:unnamed protein product [Protopolystoma xenopodis]|uniref:Uncharacterized protein n=1 Tax=Protopolystoma xenopodis TaxID=117903 RepID=A0A448WZK5_9PLAT|nr:unnamed protein product [Protopolystoma xenopodis]